MAYPIFGKISDRVYNNIQTSGKGATGGDVDITVASSELVCWVRLISATDLTPATTGSDYGLIMTSNPSVDMFSDYNSLAYDDDKITLKSVEQTPSLYGGKFSSGMLGTDFSGKGVYPYLTPWTGDLVLRPQPIVTALQIKEGKDQISRHADITIKCFSLAQAEMLQEYLMEPGHTLFIEYGWNTNAGLNEMIDTSNHRRTIQLATDIGLDYAELQVKRENSYGDYDAFYGFIVGGSLTSENENFIISVKLRGVPGLPVFLQGQHTVLQVDTAAKKVADVPSSQTYSINDITNGGGDGTETIDVKMGGRRWKWMFNKLTGNRQTPEVKKIIEEVYNFKQYGYWDFINFDYKVSQEMASQLAGSFVTSIKDFFGQKEFDVGGLTIPKEKLVSENRYIRFGAAIDILNANSGLYAYKIGSKSVTCRINNYGFIGAFPNMFSTRPDKLIIPGKMPNFYQYYCNPAPVTIEEIIEGDYIDNRVQMNVWDGKKYVMSFQGFVQTDDLPTSTTDSFYNGYYEKGGYYGKLENLYINFNVFINALKNSSNKSLRDVVVQMCNEMSSAVNSFWNLQILEIPYEDGVKLQIVDENWRGYLNNKKATVKPFIHSGEQSIFLEATLDIDIPSEMTNQIILKREDYTSNPDSQPLQMGGLFGNSKDRFFEEVDYRKTILDINVKAKDPAEPTRDAAAVQSDIDAVIATLKRELVISQGITQIYGYKDGKGEECYSETYVGGVRTATTPRAGTAVGDKLIELKKELDTVKSAETVAAETALGTNLSKIDVVPNPVINKIDANTLKPAAGFTEFNKNFKIYCLEDTQIFDIMRNNAFEQYSGLEKTSHPLPIKYSFKILGKSGLRRGDTFNVIGIPKKYRDYGFFQITEITQTLEGNTWYTDVEGQYFQQIKVN